MARKRNRPMYMKAFQVEVMRREGYQVDPERPDSVKFAVAHAQGIPLKQGDNGHLTTEAAGKIGGPIGGAMVREMVRMAQQSLLQSQGNKR